MYTVDIHSAGETVESAIEKLKTAIRMAKREEDHLLCVITGYGSKGKSSHKIKTAVLDFLSTDTKLGIKAYILGSDLDIFNVKYQSFPSSFRIPREKLDARNPGEIIIAV